MPENKDIAGKIIAFLRERGGEAEIKKEDTRKFGCHFSVVYRALKKLKKAGIINVIAAPVHKKHPTRYKLDEKFREGDGWRDALKQKPAGDRTGAGPDVTAPPRERPIQPEGAERAEGCHNEECLRARKALLEELVGVFGTLRASQEENQALRSTATELQKKVKDLEDEIKNRGSACHQLREDVKRLESQLRALRVQTSQPPAAGTKLRFDGSGVVILPGEGLPDRS